VVVKNPTHCFRFFFQSHNDNDLSGNEIFYAISAMAIEEGVLKTSVVLAHFPMTHAFGVHRTIGIFALCPLKTEISFPSFNSSQIFVIYL